ncbi:radical SAM/SPASM domain-containing protein [Candidatus Omnitrophota bacterium]
MKHYPKAVAGKSFTRPFLMSAEKVRIEANANFHHIAGDNLFEKNDNSFKEYRKRWKEWPEKFYTGDFPLFIDIEVTSRCNLKCPFCSTTYRDKHIDKGFISFDIVKKIIDEGAENGLYGVKFNYRGEPLLHKEICKFVSYAKDRGLVDVYFNTNAVLLNGDTAKALIEAGLDRISISAEGYTKDIYEKYRIGSDFERVLSNIINLQNEKKKRGVQYPRVRIQTVLLDELKDSMEDYERFWSKIADEVAYLDYKEMKDRKKRLHFPWACPQIWQRMQVWWDGTILPCNHDDEAGLRLGNIKDTTIKEAWNSDFLNSIRDKHKNGLAHEMPSCDGCYLRDSEIGKITR